jgi:hypothetical protein
MVYVVLEIHRTALPSAFVTDSLRLHTRRFCAVGRATAAATLCVPARHGQSPVLCADALSRVASPSRMLNARQHIPAREGMTVGYLDADPKALP